MKIFFTRMYFLIACLGALHSFAQNSHVQPDQKILIKLKPTASEQPVRKKGGPPTIACLESLGISNYRLSVPVNEQQPQRKMGPLRNVDPFGLTRIYEFVPPARYNQADLIALLEAHPDVEYAEEEKIYTLQYTPLEPNIAAHWGHFNTQVFDAWDLTKGDTSVVIGIVDSGVNIHHPGLRQRLHYNIQERFGLPGVDDDGNGFVDDSVGYDFALMSPVITDPFGHGTEVTGVAVAQVNDNQGSFGVGFNCRFMPIKVVANDGRIRNLFQAIYYAGENGCKVINVSIGRAGGGISRFEEDIINHVTLVFDALIVAAAGNTPREIDFYPASYQHVLSVIHSTRQDERFTGGSFSRFIDVMAPGAGIPTTTRNGGYSMSVTGSSYAAPFASGAAGLVRSRFPHLKAPQVHALLRNTADDVYGLPGNIDFAERLGKGRLNVLKAVSNPSPSPAIRMERFEFEGLYGQYFLRGDTIQLWCHFENRLASTDQPLTVTLQSNSPHVEVISGSASFHRVLSGAKFSNRDSPFLVYLKPDIPRNFPISFRLGYESGSYQDFQYFDLTSAETFDVRFNQIACTMEADGRLGFTGFYPFQRGIGLLWDNMQVLNGSGMIMGTTSGKVTSAFSQSDGTLSNQFTPDSPPLFSGTQGMHYQTVSRFEDRDPQKHPGLKVTKTVKGWRESPHQNYILIEFVVENTSNQDHDSLFIGLLTDWKMDEATSRAKWDPFQQFAYIQDQSYVAAIKPLATRVTHLTRNNEVFPVPVDAPATLSGLYEMISQTLDQTEQEGKLIMTVGGRNYQFKKNTQTVFTYLLALGHDLPEIRQQIRLASQRVDIPKFNSPTPTLEPVTFCEGEPLKIFPSNGQTFNLYHDASLLHPIVQGSSFVFSQADTASTFYVTNVDQLIESPAIPLRLNVRPIQLGILSPDSLNLRAESQLEVLVDVEPGYDSLIWELDGQRVFDMATTRTFEFAETGVYQLAVTVKQSATCAKTVTKNIIVFKSTLELGEVTLEACQGSPVQLGQAGEVKLWYDAFPLGTPVAKTDLLSLDQVGSSTSFFASNTDTLDQQFIRWNLVALKPNANFSVPDSLNLGVSNQLVLEAQDQQLKHYRWLLDGVLADTLPQAKIQLPEPGVYAISLETTDSVGCTSVENRQVVAFLPMVTGINPDPLAVALFQAYPNPSKGQLHIKAREGFSGTCNFVVYDMAGRALLQQKIDLQGQNPSTIQLKGLSEGLYKVAILHPQGKWATKLTLKY
jgi:hypothetical protein